MLERYWFQILTPLFLVLAIAVPLHALLACGLLVEVLQIESKVGVMRIDPTDVLLAALLAGLVIRGRAGRAADPLLRRSFRLWFLLGFLLCVSYLLAPVNQSELTDPMRIGYQLIRYCWKPIAFFPFALILLRTPAKAATLIGVAVLTADLFALEAIQQGYAGQQGTGPFITGNQLGGTLVVPTVFALAGVVVGGRRRGVRLFYGLSLLLIGRALLFTGSRGAFVSVFLAVGLFSAVLLTLPAGRQRIIRIGALAGLLLLAILMVKPDLASRPSIQQVRSISEGTQADTFQWRIGERWPHFLRRALERPLFGYGTAADPSLGDEGGRGNTPHNGYLSLAATYGFPVTFLFLFFALVAVRNGFRLLRHSEDPQRRVLGLALVAGMAGVLCHNMIESSLSTDYVAKMFWLICALSSGALRWPEDRPRMTAEQPVVPRVSRLPAMGLHSPRTMRRHGP